MQGCVTVDVNRYEALISREAKFDVVETAYHAMESWQFSDFCKLIFGEKPEKETEE